MKRLLSFFLVPITKRYLQKRRRYKKHGIRLMIEPGVFHPGLFFSSNYLWSYLKRQDLSGKSFLEIGCGSGMISILAAKAGAHVTATDINEKALNNSQKNAAQNNVDIHFLVSDLFENLDPKVFDYIVINPPYYKGEASNNAELAWYAGENYEYFDRLFAGISPFTHLTSHVIMVVSEGCDVDLIQSKAIVNGIQFNLIEQKKFWLEINYLYQLQVQ